jgi:D-glycero-D-manno-heptose 1,7-bisphosphate phosphatase
MLCLFDLDGTLIVGFMSVPGKKYGTRTLLPGRKEKLQKLIANGHTIGIVTNQGGIAFNMSTPSFFERKVKAVIAELELPADTPVKVCYHHAKSRNPQWREIEGVKRRKPSGAMIRELVEEFPEAASDGVMYIGDRPEDQAAAKDAGVEFQWEYQFFAAPKEEEN